ncbi:uncharacterized protein DNG_09736 [Cephalotrichum gorgonifer]|uniref:FAD/NAD(P)-binding domain-containing protein n=1 Tax=Cephalotrichum gorgonifer TaxID=2041049 RepID=A0AAE8N6E8_9PEZI|nr:uncharacterized protein DNG_09736 [Cephalotrichum gorgonifer]
MKHVVIVGGSFAGVGTAHRILKQAAKSAQLAPFKITLVSRDSHFYWNLAAPRAVIPGELSDDQLFRSIAEGFAHYPSTQFEFVLGSATGIDTDAKTVQVTRGDDDTAQELNYDYLILSTGASDRADTPFKSRGSTEATKDALHELQRKVEKAETIIIAGAGVTGVETAGELKFAYGARKRVTLLSSGSVVLPGRPASVSSTAQKQLHAIGVDLKLGATVASQTELPDGRQELTFGDGQKLVADLYIPSFGVVPNTSFLPEKLLDSAGKVKVGGHLNVKGVDDVFAIGEVADTEPGQYFTIEKQASHMAKSMIQILSGNAPLPYVATSTSMGGLLVGKKAGTGHFGNYKLPSFLVVIIRKSLFVDKFPGAVDGSAY